MRVWLRFLLATLTFPLLIILLCAFYWHSLLQSEQVRSLETDAREQLEKMRLVSETEKYLCKSFTDLYVQSGSKKDLQSRLESFAADHRIELRFLIWKNNGEIFHTAFDMKDQEGDWQAAYLQIRKVFSREYGRTESDIPAEVLDNLRKVFGPHFFARYIHMCFSDRFLSLLRTDATLKKPLLWLNVSKDFGLAILLPHGIILEDIGLKKYIRFADGKITSGYVENGIIRCHDENVKKVLQKNVGLLQRADQSQVEIDGLLVFTNFINSRITGFCVVRPDTNLWLSSGKGVSVIFVLIVVFVIIFSLLSFRVLVLQKPFYVGIRNQLLLLFIVANAMPGLILLVIGSDYLQQFDQGLRNSVFNQTLTYLQNIDELFINAQTIQKHGLRSQYEKLKANLRKNKIDRHAIRGFIDSQSPRPYRFFMVASSTGIVAGETGILKDGKVHISFNNSFAGDSIRISAMQALQKLGVYIMSILNKKSISMKLGTEAEMIAESFMQMKPEELVRLFLERGTFWQWGIGTKKHPTFVDYLQLSDKTTYDYVLFYLWDSYVLEQDFIRRIYHNINRNEYGARLAVVNDHYSDNPYEESLKNDSLREFALKLRDRTITRPEFADVDGETHMLVGHKCIFMEHIRLVAMLPLEKIEAQVRSRSNLLLLLGLVSVLVSISLGLFMSSGILQPLSQLKAGVDALRERQFSHRLPDLGGDEFGHLARIFNETLVDLEEMHTASMVQEKLMTQMSSAQSAGNIEFFARPFSRSGMGNDYFEVCEIAGQAVPGIIIGEVPARGIANCLILSFVKSACMQLTELYDRPVEFVAGLYGLLQKSSKISDKARIKLQYLHIADGNALTIVNAGLLSPVCYRISEKRLQYPEADEAVACIGTEGLQIFRLRPDAGDIILSFTGGLLSERFADSEMPVEVLHRTFSNGSEAVCNALLDEIVSAPGNDVCKNDFTLLVLSHSDARVQC